MLSKTLNQILNYWQGPPGKQMWQIVDVYLFQHVSNRE